MTVSRLASALLRATSLRRTTLRPTTLRPTPLSRRATAVPRSLLLVVLAGCTESTGPGDEQPLDLPAEATGSFAFVGVTLIPMTTNGSASGQNGVVPDQTVVVDDGRISAIGPAATMALDPAVTVISADEELFLMPGLADMHTHMHGTDAEARNDLLVYLANGVTTIRDMWGDEQSLRMRDAVAAGTVAGPRVIAASPGLDGPQSWVTSLPVETTAEGRARVAQYAAAGYDMVKVYTMLEDSVFRAIADEARLQDIEIAGHVSHFVPFADALAEGQRTIEHLWGFAKDASAVDDPLSIYNAPLDAAVLNQLAAVAAAAPVWSTPTFAVNQLGATDPDVIRTLEHYRYVSPSVRARFERGFAGHADPTQARHNLTQIMGSIRNAGVKMLLGTDANFGFMIPGFSIHDELELLVAAGLSPAEALATGTRNAADYMDERDDWGTIEVGQRADLLLLRRNPLVSITATREIAGVTRDGHWRSRPTLDALLEGVAASYGR